MKLRHAFLALCLMMFASARADIPRPQDAPQPLSPAESAKLFQVPAGYQIRLLASEPLIREPSGICWDDKGRCFVCELHGYNVEGQYDIDELNKSGQLDLEVRRIQASEAAKKKAEAETYGTVKLLRDTDGDGVMDQATVWADRLPPCYGIAAANGGLIVACAPHIVFLKDSDGDDRADVNEKLFTGFGTGNLERGINAPTLGPDGWYYFGRGWAGGQITGPHLARPVTLPATDFRIRADGSAIEPVSGSTKTMGMAFTPGGERFVCTTTHPGLYVTPIPWRYLMRNPDAAAPLLDAPASDDTRVYPISRPHPWRTKREQHAEYFAFYRKISLSDAAASGYFTSACGPLIWRGQYFVCEPAQNLVHRADIVRDGTRLRLQRVKGEEQREFLSSRDSWFHPMSLAHTPQGGMAICDFYREIIEDYSAIPRHLQQQYGVINGHDHGRIWILEATQPYANPKLSPGEALVLKLRQEDDKPLDAATRALSLQKDLEPGLALQLALSVGADKEALLALARNHGQLKWMDAAIASSAHHLEKELLLALAADTGQSQPVMHNLAGIIASRGDAQEISACLAVVTSGKAGEILRLGLEETKPLPQQAEPPVPAAPSAEQNAAWEKRVPAVLAALKEKPDLAEGRLLFQAICGACHRSHGLGVSVGPDLDAEFQRAPEVILRDVLFPSEAARPGYDTLRVKTQRGETLLGIAASDSPTSVTLKLPGGTERTILRKRADIRTLRNISLMPAGLGDALKPEQIASIIAFLRSAP
ncbi:PVC-type heme-binding CxxCH protein [Prosthecobacter sp.]|uniref:PVC-type heme-binding CxxCH protein n=1 Tax=Prosthecobacter sp. TaxID=1965333 RepID=UPI0037842E4C